MYRLLIADDEIDSLQGLANYFPWHEVGFEVTKTAHDGQEALDYMLQHAVDAALCDIRMPRLSGLDIAKEVRRRALDVVVVLLSAYRDFSFAQEAIASRVERYIVKPSTYSEIREVFSAIREELGARQNVESPSGKPGYHDKLIAAVKAYVRENYATTTLEDAASYVGFSPSYLSRCFHQRTQELFSEYLLRVRMEQAERLLADISLRIQDVSALVGYANPKNFARVFRNYFGQNPSEFRGYHT